MQRPLPPLNALRAFEAAARHLSLTRAAEELHVTPGALSHQIRGLEEMLGLALFERRVRSIALTAAGSRLYPGLQTGFMQIRQAVNALDTIGRDRVLVVSTPPGFTAKWLAPRLHRFAIAHPEIDVRISSTMSMANFRSDGVDVAVRNVAAGSVAPPHLALEKLVGLSFVPVCSPDGSVTILSTPGHTPGHQSLLVKLPNTGAIVLSGDAVHFRDNWDNRRVPSMNANKDQSTASMQKIADTLGKEKAQLWINHDKAQRDSQKMAPEFYD